MQPKTLYQITEQRSGVILVYGKDKRCGSIVENWESDNRMYDLIDVDYLYSIRNFMVWLDIRVKDPGKKIKKNCGGMIYTLKAVDNNELADCAVYVIAPEGWN